MQNSTHWLVISSKAYKNIHKKHETMQNIFSTHWLVCPSKVLKNKQQQQQKTWKYTKYFQYTFQTNNNNT